MTRWLLGVPLLTVVYLFALASFDPWDALAGVAAAVAALAVAGRLLEPAPRTPLGELPRRAAGLLALAAVTLREISVGTWQVALVVLHVRPLRSPGIVTVPIGERSPVGVAVSGLVLSLTPGELLVDVDWERGLMLVHVLDAGDPDAVRRQHAELYERRQKGAFP